MNSETSLKDLERNIFQETFRDGTIDIMIGCVLLMFVIAPLLSSTLGDFWSSAIFLPFWLAAYLGLRAIKKAYILPRLGQVEFSAYRKKRLRNINLVILVFNLAALGFGLLTHFGVLESHPWIPFSIMFLVGFSLVGFMVESPRLYLYGILTALAPYMGEYLYQNHGFSHHGIPVTFGVLSGTFILIGLVLMLSIFRRYPLSEKKDPAW